MNYNNIYKKLIDRAKERQTFEYTEKHHIIPKCIGGADDIENIAVLTEREHFIAHQLLVKIYPDQKQLAYAAYMMTKANSYQIRAGNRLYAWLKEKSNDYQKTREFTEETRKRMSESALKREKLTCPKCGKTGSPSNMKRWHFDNCGKKLSSEMKIKMQSSPKKAPNIVTCPHCNKSGGDNVMYRFHFDNCGIKQKLETVKCPHCSKEGSLSNMRRWHFDNCKHKS